MSRLRFPALAIVLFAVACSSGGDSSYGPNPPPPPPPAPPPPPPAPGTVDIRDNFFTPTPITVTAGTTVTWNWRGGLEHTLTFEDNVGSSPGRTTGSVDRTFGTAGTFRYRCTNHSTSFTSGMIGSVVAQ